jgi:polysaccharide export outer membrane protein
VLKQVEISVVVARQGAFRAIPLTPEAGKRMAFKGEHRLAGPVDKNRDADVCKTMNFYIVKFRSSANMHNSCALFMISRACIISFVSTICFGASCAFGIAAGTNDPGAPAVPSTTGSAQGASTLVSGQTGDATNLKSDSARKLTPNDVISVTVYGEDDLAVKSTTIDENGMVMLPLLGQMKISGMTIEQAKEMIRQRYDKDLLVNPDVTVSVEKFAERYFAVLGQVQKPGSFEFPQNQSLNLLEAIAKAGGYTRLGAPNKVDVRRIENGDAKIYHLDADKMSKDSKEKPFEIKPGDNITVRERII